MMDKINLRKELGTEEVINEQLIVWDDDHYESELEEVKDNMSELKFLFKTYNEFKDSCELHYPAYYVKGKNGPYIYNICLIPKNLNDENSDYTYYKGVYIGLLNRNGHKGVSIYIDGADVYSDYDFGNNKDSFVFNYILNSLTGDEMNIINLFING